MQIARSAHRFWKSYGPESTWHLCSQEADCPSVRELAAEASVNPNTMQRAFVELEKSGLVTTQRGSGRTVTEDITMIEQVQKEIAVLQIKGFFEKMNELGYDNAHILKLITETIEGGIQ